MLVENNKEIDPDLLTITTLALTAISTVATLVQTINGLRNNDRRDMPAPQANEQLENIEDAARNLRGAVVRIENVFEQQQIRTLSSDFEKEPRFGSFAPNFNAEEFGSFKRALRGAETSSSSLRTWAVHMQSALVNNKIRGEEGIADELNDLVDVSNQILFETRSHREQVRLVKVNLERIERAVEGARRRKN